MPHGPEQVSALECCVTVWIDDKLLVRAVNANDEGAGGVAQACLAHGEPYQLGAGIHQNVLNGHFGLLVVQHHVHIIDEFGIQQQ